MSHGATRHRPNLTVKPECTVTLACQCLQSHEQVNSARYNSRSRLGQSRFLPYGQSPRERTQRKERKQRQRFSSSAAGNPANSAAGNSVTAGTYPLGGTTAMSVEEGDIMYRYAPYEYNDVNIRVTRDQPNAMQRTKVFAAINGMAKHSAITPVGRSTSQHIAGTRVGLLINMMTFGISGKHQCQRTVTGNVASSSEAVLQSKDSQH